MKSRIEEYEDKIKKLIKEFEDESKKHIKEVNELHEHYRSFKSKAQELDQRIDQYKKDS
jgi:predicted  nucleic acid-binding Zn-ribbon protein